MTDEHYQLDEFNYLVNHAYASLKDGAFFDAATKLRQAASLIEHHIRQCYMEVAGLTTHEVEVLRLLNGEDMPDLVAGAAMNECCEALKSKGYVAGNYHITDLGRVFLKTMNYGETGGSLTKEDYEAIYGRGGQG